MHLRKARMRDGQPSMTGPMLDILRYLLVCKADETPFAPLEYPFAHGITVEGLLERGWIFQSPGLDGVRYRITGLGEEALRLYERRINRRDGICPRCGVRPRHVRASGVRAGFCLECDRARCRGKQRNKAGTPCPRCGGQRYQYPGGDYSAYCEDCARETRRVNGRKEERALLERIRAGESVPMCKSCKAKPRRVFVNSVSSYCAECLPVMTKRSKLKRVLRAHAT